MTRRPVSGNQRTQCPARWRPCHDGSGPESRISRPEGSRATNSTARRGPTPGLAPAGNRRPGSVTSRAVRMVQGDDTRYFHVRLTVPRTEARCVDQQLGPCVRGQQPLSCRAGSGSGRPQHPEQARRAAIKNPQPATGPARPITAPPPRKFCNTPPGLVNLEARTGTARRPPPTGSSSLHASCHSPRSRRSRDPRRYKVARYA